MLAQLLQVLGIVTLGASAIAFVRARLARANAPRAHALARIGAGYLLFGAHAWRLTTPAAVWWHLLLDVGAFALVASGSRALARTAGPVERFAEGWTASGACTDAEPESALIFVHRLAALAPGAWTQVVAHAAAHATGRAAAYPIVHAIAAHGRLGAAERSLTLGVDAALRGPGARTLSNATRTHALAIAHTAALAVLMRRTLATEDFDALYAPFEGLIPATTLRPRGAIAELGAWRR